MLSCGLMITIVYMYVKYSNFLGQKNIAMIYHSTRGGLERDSGKHTGTQCKHSPKWQS